MKEEKKNGKKKKWIIILIILVAAAVAAAGTVYYLNQKKETNTNVAAEVVPWDTDIKEEEKTQTTEDEIIIPGYTKMTMKANQKEQAVSMGNPAANTCYFVIVLRLTDGTVLFESDYLKPGEGIRQITMNQELEAGTYEAEIDYQCYSLEDKSPLNNGTAEFTLEVQ